MNNIKYGLVTDIADKLVLLHATQEMIDDMVEDNNIEINS